MLTAYEKQKSLPLKMKGNYSGDNPAKRTAGYVGQIAARKWLSNAIDVDHFDYDLLVGDVRVEVKTQVRQVNPCLNYWGRIAASNDSQLCDYYLFCQAQWQHNAKNKKLRHGAFICGMLSVNEMREVMHFSETGSIEANDSKPEKGSCWKIEYGNCITPEAALKIIKLESA